MNKVLTITVSVIALIVVSAAGIFGVLSKPSLLQNKPKTAVTKQQSQTTKSSMSNDMVQSEYSESELRQKEKQKNSETDTSSLEKTITETEKTRTDTNSQI